MMSVCQNREMGNEVLVAYQSLPVGPRWLGEMDQAFKPVGMTICRAHTTPAAIARVELGGLAAAVLIADLWEIDGLALLRIIRSIDGHLPCWLITDDPTRSTLEAALALRATCVMNHPPTAGELALVLRRRLLN
jgi:CheY-like chemotaxis protein